MDKLNKKIEKLENKINLIEKKLDAFMEAFCMLHESQGSARGRPVIAKILREELTKIEQRYYEMDIGEED